MTREQKELLTALQHSFGFIDTRGDITASGQTFDSKVATPCFLAGWIFSFATPQGQCVDLSADGDYALSAEAKRQAAVFNRGMT